LDRENAKLDKDEISRAFYNYGIYREHSSYTNVFSNDELKEINPKKLVILIHGLFSYDHKIFYYGQKDINKIKKILNRYHKVSKERLPYPEKVKYQEVPTDENRTYFVDYDMTQVEVMMLSKDVPFNRYLMPNIEMFNEYYGGNMYSVVFQDIRESKALAYSAYCEYLIPYNPDESHYVEAFISTQPDKLQESFSSLFQPGPASHTLGYTTTIIAR